LQIASTLCRGGGFRVGSPSVVGFAGLGDGEHEGCSFQWRVSDNEISLAYSTPPEYARIPRQIFADQLRRAARSAAVNDDLILSAQARRWFIEPPNLASRPQGSMRPRAGRFFFLPTVRGLLEDFLS